MLFTCNPMNHVKYEPEGFQTVEDTGEVSHSVTREPLQSVVRQWLYLGHVNPPQPNWTCVSEPRHRTHLMLFRSDSGWPPPQPLSTLTNLNNTFYPPFSSLFLQVIYTYDVEWKQSDVTWSHRWDVYFTGNPDDEIHYFSIVNSLMIVLFLTGPSMRLPTLQLGQGWLVCSMVITRPSPALPL